jgi:CRISPR-associated endonuclease/helicase Cas3
MLKFYSHAIEKNDGSKEGSKFLKDHLHEVGIAIEKLTNQAQVDNLKLIPPIGYLLGVAHDFGKYTTFFQEYLLHNKKDPSSKHHHGFISAIFAAYLVDKFPERNESNNKYLPLIAYFVVLHHHGDLNALELDVVKERDLKEKDFLSVAEPWRSKLKALQHQLNDIRENLTVIEAEYEELLKKIPTKDIKIANFQTSWRNTFSNIYKLHYQLIVHENDEIKLTIFITTLFLYSLLIDADKKDAADVGNIKRREIPSDLVDKFRKDSPEIDTLAITGINGIRNEIYRNVTEKILAVPLSNHIFTFTAPTGTGKTLASLSCALKLRERLMKSNGYIPRVIYSLPFTSIIDQNYTVIKNVLGQLPDFNQNESSYLIKHHHLEDLKYKTEDEERTLSESLLLVESWESEIIVTTFIQLLHSIIGFKNRFLKKFHNIAGSILLLDEVQNIPVEYWPLINKMFKLLVEHLGCYIILLTATKPLIFDEEEATPLLMHSEEYFKEKGLNRITLIPDVKPILLAEFFQKFKKLYDKSNSYLIVLNTVKSSIIFYEMLKSDNVFKDLIEKKYIFYLSTNIIPKERAERIKKIKEFLDKKEKIIVISTQVVEAGIDIDLDIAIRDIGPIDSIVQVSGRCNRGMGDNKGKVYIFNLTDEHCSYAKYVYGNTHFIISHDLLSSKTFEESQFFDLINQYFTIITQKKNQDDSKHIWDAIRSFRFHHPDMKSVSDFELIKEKYGYVDIFVEIDEYAKELLAKYISNVVKEKNFQKRQNNYLSMRKDFNSYIISIPKKLSEGLSNINDYLLKVPYKQIQAYYSDDTGFKRIDDESFIF